MILSRPLCHFVSVYIYSIIYMHRVRRRRAILQRASSHVHLCKLLSCGGSSRAQLLIRPRILCSVEKPMIVLWIARKSISGYKEALAGIYISIQSAAFIRLQRGFKRLADGVFLSRLVYIYAFTKSRERIKFISKLYCIFRVCEFFFSLAKSK